MHRSDSDHDRRAVSMSFAMYNSSNTTTQAYLSAHRRDAQTGGLLVCGVDNLYILRIIRSNTPAMPLYDAHFGGFFASGVCK